MSPDTGPIGNPLSSAGSPTEFPARAPQRLSVSFEFSPRRRLCGKRSSASRRCSRPSSP